jgi:hypothetical protein
VLYNLSSRLSNYPGQPEVRKVQCGSLRRDETGEQKGPGKGPVLPRYGSKLADHRVDGARASAPVEQTSKRQYSAGRF